MIFIPPSFAPLLPLLIDKLELDAGDGGLALPVFMQMPSLFGPFIGYLADRFTVRYLVIFAPAITATLATMIGFMPSLLALTALLLFWRRGEHHGVSRAGAGHDRSYFGGTRSGAA